MFMIIESNYADNARLFFQIIKLIYLLVFKMLALNFFKIYHKDAR